MKLDADEHHVRADSARLQQIWWNLLNNAIKFTPTLGEITVRTTNDDDGQLLVEVSDSGIGIEPDAMDRLFIAFEQANADQGRQMGGMGLGLAISRALATAHGGVISAASEGHNRGATFSVRLPTINAVARNALPRFSRGPLGSKRESAHPPGRRPR